MDDYYSGHYKGGAIAGGVWRGFEACYPQTQPYLDHYAVPDLLAQTLQKSFEHKPHWAQIMTWDDCEFMFCLSLRPSLTGYISFTDTEGTQIEPSFLISAKEYNCNSINSCANGPMMGGTPDCSLPYCPGTGRSIEECRGASPQCAGVCNGGRICSPYRDLITLYKSLVNSVASDQEVENLLHAIPRPPVNA
jgi:hypothetical protein